jgi:Zn-dependent metalloprotease
MTTRKASTATIREPIALGERHLHHDHHHNDVGTCSCFIVPKKVLERFANDNKLSTQQRQYFADAAKLEDEWRKTRAQAAKLVEMNRAMLPTGMTAASIATAAPPTLLVFDCQHGIALPGVPIPNPDASSDPSAKRAFKETKGVVDFYQQVFGRNSLDNAGLTLISSIHFSVNYNNAGWNGTQMSYGDGDGNIFIDFTKSNDVIGHELTHGITQFTAAFAYKNQSGGLNESMSDVFGSMFRQWSANQTVSAADWLIGKEIVGPGAAARGFTCLRDMSNPAAKHCLAPQPTHFSQYQNGMDPHDASGFPNLAFYKAATAIGGKSWEKTGKIWYQALTGFAPSPNMKMSVFANRTRTLAGSLFPADPTIKAAVDAAWKAVGL